MDTGCDNMGLYEYRYEFSVDEEIIRRYNCNNWRGKFIFESRISFTVKAISGEISTIDSESYIHTADDFWKGYLHFHIGMRPMDYWMPHPQISTMIDQFMHFAKQIDAAGRQGKIPVAVDLEIRTVQRDGEAMAAAVERAMRPEFVPPLYLYPLDAIGHPKPVQRRRLREYDIRDLEKIQAASIGVEDVEKASSVMDLCGVCGLKPIVGTQIAPLPCGHVFHYHCIAPPLLEESNSCPTCYHQPAFTTLSFEDFFPNCANPAIIPDDDDSDDPVDFEDEFSDLDDS